MALTSTGQVVRDAPVNVYRVDTQQETVEFGPSGRPERGIRVYFTSGGGHQGSVFLPYGLYTVPNVQAAVVAAAHVLDQVGQLRG